jgi:hypothetical protein
VLLILSIAYFFTMAVLCIIAVDNISYEKVLRSLPFFQSLVIIIIICSLPLVNTSSFLLSIYYVENNAAKKQKNISEKLNIMQDDINTYMISEQYENIRWKLNKISSDIKEIANNLKVK